MKDIFKNEKYIPILGLICAFGWSLAYPFIKIGYAEFGISDIPGKIFFAGIRFLLAGLLVVIFTKGRLDINKRSDYRWLVLMALVNTALHYAFAYIGLGYNASARSTILDSMGSFITIILSLMVFADDRVSFNKLLGCVLGIGGIVIINIEPGTDFFANITFMGDGMILLNALCSGFGGLITRICSRKMNVNKATGYSMALGGAMMLVLGIVTGFRFNWNISVKGICVLMVLVLISAVCFGIYNKLVASYPISRVAIYNALIPVLGVVFAALLLGEALKWQYFVAMLLVSFGILVTNR